MLDAKSRQDQFPSLEHMTYLNTAAEGIPSAAVRAALERYWQDKLRGMQGRRGHFAMLESAKRRVSEIYHLTPDEVTLCSCSSEAFNLLALAIQLREGDEVVINDLDFPAGATPWLQPNCPATVKLWRSKDGALRVEDLAELLTPRTRLVATSLVSFFNGYRIDVREVLNAVRKKTGAIFALDATQALGRIPVDCRDLDVVISSSHKWILATHGGALVGVPKAAQDRIHVRAGGWFNQEDAFSSDRFTHAETKPGAAGFSVGMPNFPAVYAIDAALEFILNVGVEKIASAVDPLVRQCLDEISRLPVELLTPARPENLAGIISFRHPKMDRLNTLLLQRNIHVMSQAGRMRIALHGYNTYEDIERFVRCLRDGLKNV
jgi:cysteine desulfurase / selenocysteine lyase